MFVLFLIGKERREDKHIPNGDEVAKHLLKLDQLSEFGLNFFTDETNDLKSEALPSMLLNEVSSSHSSSVSRERGQNVHFCTFHDYTSSSTFPTISPKHDNTELIEVFPLTEDILIATSISNNTTEKSSAIFSAADPVESEDFTAETSKLYVESSDATKFHCTNLSHEKKIIYSKSNLENKLPVVDSKFPNSKISNEIKFVTDVVGEEPVLYDNTELENKINDTLLDMLQKKIGTSTCNAPYYFRPDCKTDKECLKFFTILPPNSDGKTINLMVKGKTCRSKQPLRDSELRLVRKILNNENNSVLLPGECSYKNVYYDAESDMNIRYEVTYELAPEQNVSPLNVDTSVKSKKKKAKNEQLCGNEQNNSTSDQNGYVSNSVARTRCGRISRPPRHVIRDYKRLKRLNVAVKDGENEKENTGGSADYLPNEDSNVSSLVEEKEKKMGDLYGPLEPSKRHFSSLSRCPTCHKVYLGYRRMVVHFQKFPEHKNEEILRRLFISAQKKKLLDEIEVPSDMKNDTINELVDSKASVLPSSHNSILKKKRRMVRKIRDPKNRLFDLKELLSTCGVEDIIKYAAPVVANVLSSWDYLMMRSKHLKKEKNNLVISFLIELRDILRRVKTLSHYFLKPCISAEENQSLFRIEREDVLQYVLGVAPGLYVVSDNENWLENLSLGNTEISEAEFEKSNSAFISTPHLENLADANEQRKPEGNEPVKVDSFYKLPDSPAQALSDLVRDIEKDLAVISNTVSKSTLKVDHKNNLMHINSSNTESSRQSRIFQDLNSDVSRNGLVSSVQLPNNIQLIQKDSVNINCPDASGLDFESQSFSPTHTLNFDSLVENLDADNDISTNFPVNLPMLLGNTSESRECLDLLNSLKNIDCSDECDTAELKNAISSDLTITSQINERGSGSFKSTSENTTPSGVSDFTSINAKFF